MSLFEVKWNPTRRELQQFSRLWVGFFGILGVMSYWGKHSPPTAEIFWAIALLGVAGYFVPGAMRPVYVVWMALALPIGWTVSHGLLLAVFYLIVTPVGFVMRLVRYDPLAREFDRSAKSYWTPHDPAADAARYFKQY